MIKPLIITLKPTITALVFLLVSSYLQGVLDKAKGVDPCPPPVTTISKSVKYGVLGLLINKARNLDTQFNNPIVKAGSRTLIITRHAAERMRERAVGRELIHLALDQGKLFAYKHTRGGGLIKIGYYVPAGSLVGAKGVFVAVNQTHEKILTVIRGVPIDYVSRLVRER